MSPSEVTRLLEGAQALRPPLWAATHEALSGLLAGRPTGEAIALDHDDVDLATGPSRSDKPTSTGAAPVE
jgi:hypothetical protein